MTTKFKILTKSEENDLTPEEKKAYRKQKKEYEKALEIQNESLKKSQENLLDQNLTKDEYLSFFKSLDISLNDWKKFLLRNYSAIYSFRKRFGVLGKEGSDAYTSYIEVEGHKYLSFFEAAYEFFTYKKYEEIQRKLLIEGLKFPLKEIRNLSISYLQKLIKENHITIFFWRDLLEKRYVSGSTWILLIEYHKTAVEQGIDKDIAQAIDDFLENPDKYHRDIVQTTEKWEKLNINPVETYKSNL